MCVPPRRGTGPRSDADDSVEQSGGPECIDDETGRIAALEAENSQLRERLADLEARLDENEDDGTIAAVTRRRTLAGIDDRPDCLEGGESPTASADD